jgi:hypothetical protein
MKYINIKKILITAKVFFLALLFFSEGTEIVGYRKISEISLIFRSR